MTGAGALVVWQGILRHLIGSLGLVLICILALRRHCRQERTGAACRYQRKRP